MRESIVDALVAIAIILTFVIFGLFYIGRIQ